MKSLREKTRKVALNVDVVFNPHDPKYKAIPLPEKYTVLQALGQGGMKTILLVHDSEAGRDVALAVMNRKDDLIARERFCNEARITSQLEHPNIIPLHEMSLDCDLPYFTMKYVCGDDLAEILEGLARGNAKYQKKYTLNLLLDIFLKICDAIAFAHSKGIIHLDLKPENVQVGDFGEVLVLDWGLAKQHEEMDTFDRGDSPKSSAAAASSTPVFSDSLAALTVDGLIKGTPSYMAPEQAAGKNSRRGYRTDIYALGGILYSMLTFKVPVDGRTPEETIRNALKGYIRSIRKMAPRGRGVPIQLECIAYKAMARNPDQRYASVADLKADIAAYQKGFATKAENADWMTLLFLFLRRNRRLIQVALLLIVVVFSMFRIFLHLLDLELDSITTTFDNYKQSIIREKQAELGRSWNLSFEENFSDSYLLERWSLEDFSGTPLPTAAAASAIMPGPDGAIIGSDRPLRIRYRDTLPPSDFRVSTKLALFDGFFSPFLLSFQGPSPSESYEIRYNCGERQSVFQIRELGTGKILGETPFQFPEGGEELQLDFSMKSSPDSRNFQLSLFLNGEQKLSVVKDRTFFSGTAGYRFSYQVENAELRIGSLKIYVLGPPRKVDLLEFAGIQLAKGNFANARDFYREVEESEMDPVRKLAAVKGRILTDEMEKCSGDINTWKKFLKDSLPGTELEVFSDADGICLKVHGWKSGTFPEDLPVSRLILSGLSSSLPEGISSLSSLKSLELRDGEIRSFKPLEGLPLKKLSCRNMTLPPLSGLSGLPLEEADFRNCRGIVLDGIGDLHSLRRLTLSRCGLEDIHVLSSLPMTVLDLSENRLTDVSALSSLPLTDLNLSGNQLKQAEATGSMRTLKTLDLSGNTLERLHLPSGGALTVLKADSNRLQDCSSLLNSYQLEILSLRGNGISDPPHFGAFENLRELYLDGNEITDLAFLIPGCRQLRSLGISFNRIRKLDPLASLKSLRSLDCSGNEVESLLPLAGLHLEELSVWGCPIRDTGGVFSNPPEKAFLFDPLSLNQTFLEEMDPSRRSSRLLLHSIGVLNAFRNGNIESLKSYAAPYSGRKYLAIPQPFSWDAAVKTAEKLGAKLPSSEDLTVPLQTLAGELTPAFWIRGRDLSPSGKNGDSTARSSEGVVFSRRDAEDHFERISQQDQRRFPLVLYWE